MKENPSIKILLARELSDGGFRVAEGGGTRPDATAWAVLALRAGGEGEEVESAIGRGRTQLLNLQISDGRVPIDMEHPGACWPTPLALLAWQGWPPGAVACDRGYQFLTDAKVIVVPSERVVNQIDSSLRGWAWFGGTSTWVEPTALAILAFGAAGRHIERVDQGIKLLLDRQLPHGGWNYGNTLVYDTELLPAEEYNGIALAGLAGHCEVAQVEASLALLQGKIAKLRTPQALGWGILGLAAWGRRPPDADALIESCLARQTVAGPFLTTHIALLVVAATCPRGLLASLSPSVP